MLLISTDEKMKEQLRLQSHQIKELQTYGIQLVSGKIQEQVQGQQKLDQRPTNEFRYYVKTANLQLLDEKFKSFLDLYINELNCK